MGERVLITGTSSGIGLSAAIECAAASHTVVATMRDPSRADGLREAARRRGVSIEVEALDVTSASVGERIRELVAKYGPFYALVNNAGIAVGAPFEEQSEADVRQQIETNVLGLMATTRAILPSMREAGRGRIINVSSTSGRVAMPCLSIYAATKHAVEGFSEALRWEVEPFGVGVHVVAPGTFRTAIFFENLKRGALLSDAGPYAELSRRVEALALDQARRAPPPDEVGRVIMRIVGAHSPPFRTIVGRDGLVMTTLRGVLPDRFFATGLRRALSVSRVR